MAIKWHGRMSLMLLVVLKLGQSGLAQTVAQVSAGEPAGPQPSLPYSANLVNALPDQGVAEPAGSATPATSGGTGPAEGPTKVVATFDSLTNGTNHSGPIFQDIFNLRNKSSWKGQRPVSGVGSANFQTTNVTRNPKNFPWTRGGGRLVEPPNRSSVWRQGRTGAMVNLNDDQLNCGAETVRQSCGCYSIFLSLFPLSFRLFFLILPSLSLISPGLRPLWLTALGLRDNKWKTAIGEWCITSKWLPNFYAESGSALCFPSVSHHSTA